MSTDTVVVLPVGRGGGGGGVKAAAFAPNDRDNLGSNPDAGKRSTNLFTDSVVLHYTQKLFLFHDN